MANSKRKPAERRGKIDEHYESEKKKELNQIKAGCMKATEQRSGRTLKRIKGGEGIDVHGGSFKVSVH